MTEREATRIGQGDCLYLLMRDLQSAAHRLSAWDLDGRAEWFDAAVDVLRCVPDVPQRMAWAAVLADAWPVDVPKWVLRGELMRRAEGV